MSFLEEGVGHSGCSFLELPARTRRVLLGEATGTSAIVSTYGMVRSTRLRIYSHILSGGRRKWLLGIMWTHIRKRWRRKGNAVPRKEDCLKIKLIVDLFQFASFSPSIPDCSHGCHSWLESNEVTVSQGAAFSVGINFRISSLFCACGAGPRCSAALQLQGWVSWLLVVCW